MAAPAPVANIQQQPIVNAPVAEQPAEARASQFLSVRVYRAVSIIFQALAITASLAVLGAVLAGNLPTLYLLTAAVFLMIAKAAAAMRSKLHDFENPEELQRLRAAAPHMSYSVLRREFHWADVKQYNLVPMEGEDGLRKKVLLHLSDPENLSYLQGAFGRREVQTLLEHGIIDLEIAQAIRGNNQAVIQFLINPEGVRLQAQLIRHQHEVALQG